MDTRILIVLLLLGILVIQKPMGEKERSERLRLLLILIVLLLLGILVIQKPMGIGATTFEKDWTGYVQSITTNIVVQINGKVVWNAPLPANQSMSWSVNHGDNATILWADWRGPQIETFNNIQCLNNKETVINDIPYQPCPPVTKPIP